MRVEPYGIDSILHITQRGVRGTEIVRDVHDKNRFVRSLFYLNDTHSEPNWHRQVATKSELVRPEHWPERDPLVRVLAWTLLPNHFHLLVQESREGGVAKFMQRLNGSLSSCFNTKYKEKGSLFQSSYYARTVAEDRHQQYLAFYILVKNVFDAYPGGVTAASSHFDDAWEWAKCYPYSSFKSIISGEQSPILDDSEGLISGIVGVGDAYKSEARELLDFYLSGKENDFAHLTLEP